VVGTALFAENELALPVGEGPDEVTVIRTPARYSSFDAAAAEPPPALGQHTEEYLGAAQPAP
jgi:crotonobetainyl-CoA:carnitine CoA-transferase CaiB-like acyl-CoA transferase